MAFNFDEFEIEVLADGTIKTTSDKVSASNHSNAEAFLAFVAQMAGGETTRVKRTDVGHNLKSALDAHNATEHKH